MDRNMGKSPTIFLYAIFLSKSGGQDGSGEVKEHGGGEAE